MTTMSSTRWHKAYQGPFEREEARKIAQELRDKAKPDVNSIYDARTRRRPNGGYDVYIKTPKTYEKITQ